MYEGVTAVIEAKPTELPVQSSYFQAEVEIDGKQYAMKLDLLVNVNMTSSFVKTYTTHKT